jgi:hypothetical protein
MATESLISRFCVFSMIYPPFRFAGFLVALFSMAYRHCPFRGACGFDALTIHQSMPSDFSKMARSIRDRILKNYISPSAACR